MPGDLGRHGLRVAVVAVGLACAPGARSQQAWSGLQEPHADWALSAGASHTDDATLLPNGPSDTIATAGVSGSLYRDTGHLRADIDGSAYFQDYLDNTFSNHVLGNLRTLDSYAFVPDRFTWVLQDTFGQVTLNPQLPATPTNWISANVVSTGPDAYLQFGDQFGLSLGGRYGRSDYQSNPIAQPDDQLFTGNLGLVKNFAPKTSLSLNGSVTRIEYKAAGQPGYDEFDYFGRFNTQSVRAGIMIDAGYTEVRQAGSTSSDPLLRLTVFRRLTPSWNLNLSAGSEFQNAGAATQAALSGSQVLNGQTVPVGLPGATPGGNGVANVLLNDNVFHSEHATASFDFVRPRTTIDLHASVTDQHYEFNAAGLDRNITDFGAGFTRRLRPSLTFHASASQDRQKPTVLEPGYRYTFADTGFDWHVGSWLALVLNYHHENRPADPGYPGYVENVIYLGLTYGPPKHNFAGQAPPPPGSAPPTR
jgi:hypothetical protein